MKHQLDQVLTEAEWQTLHAIRRETLFAPERRPGLVYDDNHPDDHAPDNLPYLLLADGRPIGLVRLDFRADVAVVRLVAIVPAFQRQGHGTVLDRLVVQIARGRNVRKLLVNAAADAVGFYEKLGWQRHAWDADELTGIAVDCVQMSKAI
jgi:GNAT superfamily N-acetyltransferase